MVLVNNKEFGGEVFYNGEAIYKSAQACEMGNIIILRFEDNSDITNMIMAVEYLRDIMPHAPIKLIMEYIPYSRMDREISESKQIFSLKYFARIVNRCKFSQVWVLDPHSKVSTDLFDNLYQIKLSDYVNKVVKEFKPDYLFFPDKGANNKYSDVLSDVNIPKFYGSKKRDLKNKGKLINEAYELHDCPDLKGKRVLIVDDIVALGGTALAAGEHLRRAGADDVALYVSHCENGVFAGSILKKTPFAVDKKVEFEGINIISKVYTAATTPLNNANERLIVIK